MMIFGAWYECWPPKYANTQLHRSNKLLVARGNNWYGMESATFEDNSRH